jgi:hypothetical protein
LAPAPATAIRDAAAWLQSINAKSLPQSSQYFEPDRREMMDWGNGETAYWPTFSDIRCKARDRRAISEKATRMMDVLCTVSEATSPGEQPDGYMDVQLRRQPDGSWGIIDYGTG